MRVSTYAFVCMLNVHLGMQAYCCIALCVCVCLEACVCGRVVLFGRAWSELRVSFSMDAAGKGSGLRGTLLTLEFCQLFNGKGATQVPLTVVKSNYVTNRGKKETELQPKQHSRQPK